MVSLTMEPIAVAVDDAARLIGISSKAFKSLVDAGQAPAPTVNLGTRDLWAVTELRSWFAAGAPDVETWQGIKAALARSVRNGHG